MIGGFIGFPSGRPSAGFQGMPAGGGGGGGFIGFPGKGGRS
jgi:hypothetical protein